MEKRVSSVERLSLIKSYDNPRCITDFALLGDKLLLLTSKGKIRKWDLVSGKYEPIAKLVNKKFYSIVTFKDQLFTASDNGYIQQWNSSYDCCKSMVTEGKISDLVVWKDYIVFIENHRIICWHPVSNKLIRYPDLYMTESTTLSICGDYITFSARNRTIGAIEPLKNEYPFFYTHDFYLVSKVIVLGNWKDNVLIGNSDGLIVVWNPPSGLSSNLVGHSEPVMCFEIWNDFMLSGSEDKTIKIWSPQDFSCIKTIERNPGSIDNLIVWKNRIVSGSGRLMRTWGHNLKAQNVLCLCWLYREDSIISLLPREMLNYICEKIFDFQQETIMKPQKRKRATEVEKLKW